MKLRIKLAILFAVLTANASFAQDCSTDNNSRIILESQSEIDDFQSLYGPCSNVPDTLFIGGFNGQVPGIFDIDGLTGITSIQGELSIIRVPDLSSIGGLSALTYIGENLSIESAPSLTSLQPLANLSSPLTGLSIQGTGLTNLDGLEGVSSLDYRSANGTIPAGSLDMDGNGQYDALTDGLLMLRGMFGLTGNSLTNGAVATNALYTTATEIEPRISVLGELADIDGNGQADALTDGLLVLRYLFGLRDSVLVNGVVSPNGNRVTSAEIQDHMQGLMPDVEPQPNPEPEKIYVRLNSNPFAAPYYIFSSTANGSSIAPILEKGKTYIFERADSGHPFNLGTGWRSGLSGVTMSSTASSGVVSNVGSIQAGEAITITIPQSFGANSIKYYCYLHSGMVSSISIAQ